MAKSTVVGHRRESGLLLVQLCWCGDVGGWFALLAGAQCVCVFGSVVLCFVI